LQTLKLHHLEFNEILESVSNKGTLIQKAVEDYIEAKRLAFPRFFFMTDVQFLEFIELAENNKDFHSFINLLFPGVQSVVLDQPLQSSLHQKVPPPMVNDLSQVKSEFLDIDTKSKHGGKQLASQKEIKPTASRID